MSSDDALEKALDDALLHACLKGSLEEVKKSFAAGGCLNAIDPQGNNCVALACMRSDWNVSLDIVKFLLSKRFSPSLCNARGESAAHIAAMSSSAEVMKVLLAKEPHLVKLKDVDNFTPIMCLCRERFDDESVLIAEAMPTHLDDGTGKSQLFLSACEHGRPELVAKLLERGDASSLCSAQDKDGNSPLHLACLNGAFGLEMIPILIDAGVDVSLLNNAGQDALACAMTSSFSMSEMVLRYLPEDSKPSDLVRSDSDPVGNLSMRLKLNCSLENFYNAVSSDCSVPWCWATLRNGDRQRLDESYRDIFRTLQDECDEVKLWILASREPCFQQHPKTGETLFHLLAKTTKLTTDQKLQVLERMKKDFRNPLIPDFSDSCLAVDLTHDPILKQALTAYMQFRPDARVMEWFGPVFRERVFTLLLVLKRFHIPANKDVKCLLVKYLSLVEHVFATLKEEDESEKDEDEKSSSERSHSSRSK